ncbi:hypothetical protein J6590_049591 [Homalodisca vitripennis]|nr:hypothetical protein J6590_049591 [Homalodisca vitripennis]
MNFANSVESRVQRLSCDQATKQRRPWLLLGWVTAKQSCPSKQPQQPICPAVDGGSEVTFKPLVPTLSVEYVDPRPTSSIMEQRLLHKPNISVCAPHSSDSSVSPPGT